MSQDLLELIKLLTNLPGMTLWALAFYLVYKVVIYLSTAGAVMYIGKEFLQLISKYLDIKVKKETLKSYYYHGLVRKHDKSEEATDWLYNRESLEELANEGAIKEFYVSKYRVSGYSY